MNAIRLNNLTKVYGRPGRKESTRAVDGLSFDVEAGEIFGFLGPNGAGKTTTIHLLMNFIFPTIGEAFIFDRPVFEANARRDVGFLPELFHFDGFMRGATLLSYLGRLSGLSNREADDQARRLFEQFDLKPAAGKKVRQFSKGMTQKLGLTQGLIGDPKLLILDEPTSGMDPLAKTQIKKMFRQLKEQGKTIFLSSHILSDIEEIADRVAVIHRGQLVRVGRIAELRGEENRSEIVCRLVHGPARDKFVAEYPQAAVDGDMVTLVIDGRDEKNKAVGMIMLLGGELISLSGVHSTLDDIFARLVRDADHNSENAREA